MKNCGYLLKKLKQKNASINWVDINYLVKKMSYLYLVGYIAFLIPIGCIMMYGWWFHPDEFKEMVVNIKSNSKIPHSCKEIRLPKSPKPAKSAYTFFSIEIQPIIKKEYPNMSFYDRALETGCRWRDVSQPVDKKKYEQLAIEDNLRYQNEMANFQQK